MLQSLNMSKMAGKITGKSKYDPLKDYLQRISSSKTLSFAEIEQILGLELPKSAYLYEAWWANDKTHVQANSWLRNEIVTDLIKLGKSITFKRV
jgi:hypothetical protein